MTESNLPTLVWDRTDADVVALNAKGTLSAEQLNRVETWTEFLVNLLSTYGYSPEWTPRSQAWVDSEIVLLDDINRIRANISNLQECFAELPSWRRIEFVNYLDFEQANALEWDLDQIYIWFQDTIKGFKFRQANTLFMVAGGLFNNA